jgi:hypothetical protein
LSSYGGPRSHRRHLHLLKQARHHLQDSIPTGAGACCSHHQRRSLLRAWDPTSSAASAPTAVTATFGSDGIGSKSTDISSSIGSELEPSVPDRLGSSAWLRNSGSAHCGSATRLQLRYFTQSPLALPNQPALRVRMAAAAPHPA